MNSDVLIIGGGVIGLSIARQMHKQGIRRVTLIEKGVCGLESSWAAAGMLGPQAEANERDAFFDLCRESRDLYPELAAELLEETGIDIELERSGTLYLAFNDEDVAEIRERYRWQQAAGLAVEKFSADEAHRAEPFISPTVREALYFPNDWQVDNRQLCAALKIYAETNGIDIREITCVEKLMVDKGRVTGAETSAGRIFALQTVVATGAWTSLIKLGQGNMPIDVKPVRGQMIAFKPAMRLFQRIIYSRRGYIVPRSDGRILAGSTTEDAGFDKSIDEAAAQSLHAMASEIAPAIGGLDAVDQWAGLRPFADDALPIIGSIEGIDGLFIATAHYRNGILLAPLTAKLAARWLVHKTDSAYLKIFGPARFRARTAGV